MFMGLKEIVTSCKAAIFDLDGTLIDSMNVWSDIDKEFFASHNLVFDPEYQKNIGHKGLREIAIYTKERYKLTESIDEIISIWMSMAREHYSSKIPLKEGAVPFLEFLESKNIKMAIATSNSLELTDLVLTHHDIKKYFSKIVTVNELKTNKESPDIYLSISNFFSLKPSECVVFEDLIVGIETAKKAGFKAIAVKDAASIDNIDALNKKADLVIDTFNI